MNKESKEVVFIEFFGLSGGGKSTIYGLLTKELDKKDGKILIAKEAFRNYSKIERYSFTTHSLFRTILFIFRQNSLFLDSDIHNSIFKKIGKIEYVFKELLFHDFLLSKLNNSETFLADQGFLQISCFNVQKLEHTFERVLEIYKTNNLIFIFVDIPPDVAYNRIKKREKDTYRAKELNQSSAIKRKGDDWGLLRWQTLGEKYNNLYSFLLKKEKEGVILKVIKVDGEKPIIENVEFIKKEIENYE